MQQQGKVRRDLRVKLRDVLIRMSVVIGAVIGPAVAPDEVVLRVCVYDVDLTEETMKTCSLYAWVPIY